MTRLQTPEKIALGKQKKSNPSADLMNHMKVKHQLGMQVLAQQLALRLEDRRSWLLDTHEIKK